MEKSYLKYVPQTGNVGDLAWDVGDVKEWPAWISNEALLVARHLSIGEGVRYERQLAYEAARVWEPWLSPREDRLFHVLRSLGRSYDCKKCSELDATGGLLYGL